MELNNAERDLVAVGNVCARFVHDTDAKSVKSIFETVQFQALLTTWLTVATSTPVFDALMTLCWAMLPKYNGLAKLFATPAVHATFMNLLIDVRIPSQHVVHASRMLCCILSASRRLRSLFDTPAVRKLLIMTTIHSSRDQRKVHALRAVLKHVTEGRKSSNRAASQPFASVCDAFVALMNEILEAPMMEELCHETAKMLGCVVTHQVDNLAAEFSVHQTSWEAVEANLVTLRVDDWVARLMAECSVELQVVLLHHKFAQKFKTV